jgi:hypothetical protein
MLLNWVVGVEDACGDSAGCPRLAALSAVATPELHLVWGVQIPASVREAIGVKNVPINCREWAFGFVKDDYRQPDSATAIQVTAKWTCHPGGTLNIDELQCWWERVGTEAHTLEEGLFRFETHRVDGEDALVIHETFVDTDVLKFHLTKGTAAIFKSDIDKIAAPENYYFRGPVSWTIRTYSKFMRLPATHSS